MNEFFVALQGSYIVIIRPVPQRLTKQQAIELAAWLRLLADPGGEQFEAVVKEAMSS